MSQVSAFALVGETLADTGSENRGIIGMLLGLINRATRTFNSVAETKIAIEEEGSGEGSADYDYEEEGSGDVEAVSDGNNIVTTHVHYITMHFQAEYWNLLCLLLDQ